MSPNLLRILSNVCFVSGFVSIVASIVVWVQAGGQPGGQPAETVAHAERFGIFIGLWAPTFFALSDRFQRYALAARGLTA